MPHVATEDLVLGAREAVAGGIERAAVGHRDANTASRQQSVETDAPAPEGSGLAAEPELAQTEPEPAQAESQPPQAEPEPAQAELHNDDDSARARESTRSRTRTGQLRINAIPYGVVYCNGDEYGPTPLEASVRPGRYDCRVVSPQGQEVRREIEVEPGAGELVTIRFRR